MHASIYFSTCNLTSNHNSLSARARAWDSDMNRLRMPLSESEREYAQSSVCICAIYLVMYIYICVYELFNGSVVTVYLVDGEQCAYSSEEKALSRSALSIPLSLVWVGNIMYVTSIKPIEQSEN